MKTREQCNGYMKQRRELLKAKGICVDCQSAPIKKAERGKKPHVCCEDCLKARRERLKASRMMLSLPFGSGMQL